MIGFTGTREGMTDEQRSVLQLVLETSLAVHNIYTVGEAPEAPAFHHGDCVGADAQAHEIARAAGWTIILHPPDNDSQRAFCKLVGEEPELVREPLPYLERNKQICEHTNMLIACPGTMGELLRSGTWSTVRYARDRRDQWRTGHPILVIWPNGVTTWDGKKN
jgi:hypothetical protein